MSVTFTCGSDIITRRANEIFKTKKLFRVQICLHCTFNSNIYSRIFLALNLGKYIFVYKLTLSKESHEVVGLPFSFLVVTYF